MNPAVAEWISKAEGDFTTAGRELRARKSPNYDAVCFHTQQCAEKYLKAMLVSQNVEFPKTHDLLILHTLCASAGIFTGFTKEALGRLSGYAVRARYPGNQPTLGEARDALGIAMDIRKFARTFLGLKK